MSAFETSLTGAGRLAQVGRLSSDLIQDGREAWDRMGNTAPEDLGTALGASGSWWRCGSGRCESHGGLQLASKGGEYAAL